MGKSSVSIQVQSNISGGRNQCGAQQSEKNKREQVEFHVILQVQNLLSSYNEAVTSSFSFWPTGVHFMLADLPVALEIRILHSSFILSLSKDKTYLPVLSFYMHSM